jgi:DNA replicative helicase MCM subunit Mcm2 (Cdc46/Mcm family)
LQEQFRHITAGRLPQTITAVIEGDLGQNWRAGDDVVVSGIFDYRFKKPAMDQKMQLQMVIVVNSILMQRSTISKDNYDRESLFEESQSSDRFPLNFYQEASMYSKDMILAKQLEYRNTVIRNFCPTIFGREIVKLGLILSLLGGVSIHNE